MAEPTSRTERGFDRLVGFSDGVVAIAITLLVLPLTDLINEAQTETPFHLISANWPVFGAFFVTFAVVSAFWVTHHRVFELVASYDYRLAWLNLIWLLFIVLLPFASGMVNEGGFAHGAGFVYAGTMALLAVSQGLMVVYLQAHPNLLAPGVGRHDLHPTRSWGYAAYFTLIAMVAIWQPESASYLMFGLIILGFLLPGRAVSDHTERGFSRLVNFSDAVVAIAITLLVLPLANLVGEQTQHQDVLQIVTSNSSAFLAFVITFLVTGGYWLIHHRLFEGIADYDGWLIRFNLGWLVCIVLLPFATGLLQDNGFEDGTGVIYCGLLALLSGILTLIAWHVSRTPALQPAGYDRETARGERTWVFAVYLVALGLFSIPFPSIAIWGLFGMMVVEKLARPAPSD